MKLIKKQNLKRLCFLLFAGTIALFLAACGRDPLPEIEEDLKAETNPERRELLVEYAQIFRQERAKQPFDATRGLEISVIFDYPENVEYFIERGGNVNAKCLGNFSMLGYAASEHFFDVVKILVENGADVNAPFYEEHHTPLMGAIDNTDYGMTSSIRRLRGECKDWTTEKLKSEREKTIKFLFEKGADLNAQYGLRPIIFADRQGYVRTIRYRIEKNAQDGGTATLFAVKQGDVETLRWLIENGADFRKGATLEKSGVLTTPLKFAAMEKTLAHLIKNRVLLTPLKLAAMEQDVACIDILIAAGADPNEDADKGCEHTPLFLSLLSIGKDEPADFAAAQKLIDAGAKTDLPEYLIYFVGQGRDPAAVKFLLRNNANPNVLIKNGTTVLTPLFLAVREGDVECVKLLLAAGADVNAKNSLGETALFVAVRENQTELVKILLGAKADVNAKTSRGRDVLGEAVLKNNVEMVKLLLTAGAKPVEMIAMVEIPGKGFSIGKYEVTQAEYESVMGENPSEFKGSNRPVERVSLDDAMEFCKKLTEWERVFGRLPAGYEYTLPTSEQWEYACRAGTTTRFYTGNTGQDLDRAGWYEKNSGDQTHPVGEKEPNAFGLYDMHGNVWEWCLDKVGSVRVIRGGSYCSNAGDCGSSDVDSLGPGRRYYNLGFRVALVPVAQ